MKKSSKLKLHDVTILSDSEMKMVFGGTGTTGAPNPYPELSDDDCGSGHLLFSCRCGYNGATVGGVCAFNEGDAMAMMHGACDLDGESWAVDCWR